MSYLDHFSDESEKYLEFRPNYPQALFDFLIGIVKVHDLAWDCATGNGQAAFELSKYFKRVVATDLNQAQLNVALQNSNIDYRCEKAEETSLADKSVDLITVAQALHWFYLDDFYKEAKRVLKPKGIIAVWCYPLCAITPEIDKVVKKLYSEILWWPTEREYIDNEYRTIPFPFEEIPSPAFEITKTCNLEEFVHYLETWSAIKEYLKRHKVDPLTLIMDDLEEAWGLGTTHQVVWPIHVRLGVVK